MQRLALPGLALVALGCDFNPLVTAESRGADGGVRSKEEDAWFLPSVPDGGGKVVDAGACMRQVQLQTVALSRPVPFDVVIVADNSDSVSWSRDSLAAGLRNLLGHVHGHEARFFVLTSTQYGASSQDAISPFTGKQLVSWRNPVTGAPNARPVTAYTRTCTGEKGAPLDCPPYPKAIALNDFSLTGRWDFQMPAPVAAITADMTAAELAAEQKKIADAILALVGGGSDQEQPLCTLSRFLAQKPELLPRHAVFVVLADEDDTSAPDACLASHAARRAPGIATVRDPCMADCPQYTYEAHRSETNEHLTFGCVPVDDTGVAHPDKTRYEDVNTFRSGCKLGEHACAGDDVARAMATCGPGFQLRNCKWGCYDAGTTGCAVNRTDNSVDICKQPFVYSGQTYNNVPDLCARTRGPGWGTCTVTGWRPRMVPGGSTEEKTTPVVAATSTAQMIQTWKSNADRLLGAGNYSVEAIVLDPAFACPLHPGQSYGANLRLLATSAEDVFSLCADYAPALDRIERFAEDLVQTDYPLPLDDYEKVESVAVTTKAGARRVLAAGDYRYDRQAHLLRFTPGVLGAQDQALAVDVARYCERIVE